MTYDLRSLKLPRLGTGALRLVATLLESPVIGPLLLARLKSDAGLSRIRTDDVSEPPTFLPELPPDDRAVPPFVRAPTPVDFAGVSVSGHGRLHARLP